MSKLVLLAASLLAATCVVDGAAAQFGGRSPVGGSPAARPTVNPAAGARASAPTPRPMPPQAVPVVNPPVDHPAYAAQPLIGGNAENGRGPTVRPPTRGGAVAGPRKGPREPSDEAKAAARDFAGVRVAGKELRDRVDHVCDSLAWHEKLTGACVSARSTRRPIFWINSLGDLDGYG